MHRITRRKVLGLGLGTLLAGGASHAQTDWPSRAVRFIVPFPPGGGGDIAARAVAEKASTLLGQPVIVENRTGGNAVIAATAALAPPQDGYTYLWQGNNQISNPLLIKDLPFDYRTALTPVAMPARFPQVIAVRADFPARSFDEFLAYARANPGKVSCGTPPSGGMGHLALELLARRANVKFIHTPYRGGPDASRDVMGGQVDAVVLSTSTIVPPVQAGKVRVLAVTSAQRSALFPDVPTIAERGFPGYDMGDWGGLFAATGTPDALIQQMQQAVAQAAVDKGVLDVLLPQGTEPVGSKTEDFKKFFAVQTESLVRVAKEANVQLG